ncbi:MAG: sulfate adenylyltransferase small subunit [Bacteroidetes bacterium 43-93]|nr:sulfate adenylyltransferase subunit 2 [Bacteroidota bacterium]OJX01570.1 MAG: sulfate adenylyltransferase small subunit [Bacteroidetes bacterium 43-93]
MNYLQELEAEAIYVFREIAAQFTKPVLLFSGGKDSTVLIHLAAKAFHPMPIPFPVMHVDTGHNFEEALRFRDQLVLQKGLQLIIRKVEDSILEHGIEEPVEKLPSRNVLQSITLMDAIREFGFDACIGGGRRDEEKARAKERFFSVRDREGKWQPYNQKPELWNIYNGRINEGENMRVFPISNWTEMDVWQYIRQENIDLPSLYFAHERSCIVYNGRLIAVSGYIKIDDEDIRLTENVRYRTVGDMTCTAAIKSDARTIDEVIREIEASNISERGETRIDDQLSDAAMEDRKLQGYF